MSESHVNHAHPVLPSVATNSYAEYLNAQAAERPMRASLLREIFGPLPIRKIKPNPLWHGTTVAGLAQSIYDDRAFDRMPILADALEDAACDNADILSHCRQPGAHVRGCWVVDLVLGRE
jgi:hypothetical protein